MLLEGRQQEQTPASFQQNPVINVGIPINSLSVPDNTHMRVEAAAKAASPLDGKVQFKDQSPNGPLQAVAKRRVPSGEDSLICGDFIPPANKAEIPGLLHLHGTPLGK